VVNAEYTPDPMADRPDYDHAVGMVAFPPQTAPGITSPSDEALYELFQDLEDTAVKISRRAGEPIAAEELALAAASLERASALCSSPRDRPTPGAPAPHDRRAISWRLHGLANAFRRCRELSTVVREAVERSRQTSQAG
jgi:hypothetical protein